MSDLIGVCGQVRGLEAQLLTEPQIQRMVGANDATEAFMVLEELQYAQYFDQATEVADFEAIVSQGLLETKQLLDLGSNADEGLDFLWLKFDVSNLKRALKQRLIEGKTEITDFEIDPSFSRLGRLTVGDLQKLVFERKPSGRVPASVVEVVVEAENLYRSSNTFLSVELALEKAALVHLNQVSVDLEDDFLVALFDKLTLLTQFRSVARMVLLQPGAKLETRLFDWGYFTSDRIGGATSWEDLVKLAQGTELESVMRAIDAGQAPEQKLLALEKGGEMLYQNFLAAQAVGELSSRAVLISYFEKRLQNAGIIKLIMYGKLNGFNRDEIASLLA